MSGGSIEFLADYLANQGFIQRFAALFKVLPQSIINHCLISVASLHRSITKFFNHLSIKVNRYSSFSLLRYDRASFSGFEIIFLLHNVSSPWMLLSWLKSVGLYFPDRYRLRGLFVRLHQTQLLRTFFLHRYRDLQLLRPSYQKEHSQHQQTGSYVSDSCFWPF